MARARTACHSNNELLECIVSTDNIHLAWKQVRANKGAPGIDGITVEEFPYTFRECWPEIRSRLMDGSYTRTKVRNRLKLGASIRQAIITALSRKGPWHLSRTMATQSAMTNKWLSEQKLISVKLLWVRIHYPTNAR